MATSEPITKRRDHYALTAFWLAFALMVWPTESTILVTLITEKRLGMSMVVSIICFLAVILPWIASLRRHRREPNIWSGKGFLIATGVILMVNLLMVGSGTSAILRQ
jgi:predicted neutral ceramidase superfamily lipid hydrolase